MSAFEQNKVEISENGFTILSPIYTSEEIGKIISSIESADSNKQTFRKGRDLFAIRQFLREIPESMRFIFNANLQRVIAQIMGNNYFVVKSIYFDKPESSNWFVAYHQDLTISVDKKVKLMGFGPWTNKHNQFAVQPPLPILENIFTVRIHLDETDECNGALKVIPKSHINGIFRPEQINRDTEVTCNVSKGGVMIMKPLLLHSSGSTVNAKRRRVIHIEFSNQELPEELVWAERV